MSKKQIFDIGKAPHITLSEGTGEVSVKGSAESRTYVQGGMVDVVEKAGGLQLDAQSSLNLHLPALSTLDLQKVHAYLMVKGIQGEITIGEVNGNTVVKNAGTVTAEKIAGNTAFKNIDGAIQVETVMGAFALRNTQSVNIEQVQGDLSGRYINGGLTATNILGDVSLHTVSGDLQLKQVSGDLSLRNIGGNLKVEHVTGDVSLRGSLIAGKHHIQTDSDLFIRWDSSAPLKLIATAQGDIVNRLPMQNESEDAGTFIGSMGDGETTLIVEADGDIMIQIGHEHTGKHPFDEDFDFDFNFDFAGIGEQIASQMDQVANHFQQHFGEDFSGKMAKKAERAVEKALKRVEQAQTDARRKYATPPRTPQPPKPPSAPTESERLKILELLEKGAINVDEATTLLDAMGG